MKTAGVIIDFYDDPSGSILKEYFGSPEELPPKVKTAHILNQDEREILRDDAYALVMVNEGKVFRKFACVDPGNTLLSLAYFEKSAEALPEEAVQHTARNLLAFCNDFGIEPTDLVKIAAAAGEGAVPSAASGMSRTRDSFRQPIAGDEADWAARTNLMSLRGGSDSGRVIPTASAMKTASDERAAKYFDEINSKENIDKGNRIIGQMAKKRHGATSPGDLSEAQLDHLRLDALNHPHFNAIKKKHGVTHHDPLTRQVSFEKNSSVDETASAMKTASIDETARHIGVHAPAPDLQNKVPSSTGLAFGGVVPGHHPEMLDVTGKGPKHKIEKKASTNYALGDKYPLDSYVDVNNAVQYFNDYWKEMDPDDRHEYCVKTAARAEELNINVPDVMQRYGSVVYAPDLEAYMVSRMEKCAADYRGAYQELFEKRAELAPEDFATVLAQVDEVTGMSRLYGSHIMDPWFSTFGGMSEKVAEESWSWKSDTGDLVSSEQIHWLAREGRGLVEKQFSKDIADGFCKNPIQIFESLPATQKKILCNMANSKFDGPSSN